MQQVHLNKWTIWFWMKDLNNNAYNHIISKETYQNNYILNKLFYKNTEF